MKQCSSCGNKNSESNSMCETCGAVLQNSNTSSGINFEKPSHKIEYSNGSNNSDDSKMNDSGVYRINDEYQENNHQNVEKTNTFAITSLVTGIVGVPLTCCCWYLGFILPIVAIVFGFLAKKQIKESSMQEKGNGFALAGIILGFVGILIFLVIIVIGIFAKDFIGMLPDEIKNEIKYK